MLDTSGLFSIGVETHFTGYFLTGEGDFKSTLRRYAWHDLSANSYAAVLRLKGDVKLYDWKDITRVDSSTLIESQGETGEMISKIVNLNISKMIKKVYSLGYEEYNNILSDIDGKQYVHGGIAFYGGGHNYSKIDMTEFTGEMFGKYDVNINIIAKNEANDMGNANYVQGTFLPCAAGEEDFTFFLYNRDSNFDYNRQIEELKSGDAYSSVEGVLQ